METSAEWSEWFRLTPAERFRESQVLWSNFILLGGSHDPEPDHQSPFFDEQEWRRLSLDGGAGLRVVRRCGI